MSISEFYEQLKDSVMTNLENILRGAISNDKQFEGARKAMMVEYNRRGSEEVADLLFAYKEKGKDGLSEAFKRQLDVWTGKGLTCVDAFVDENKVSNAKDLAHNFIWGLFDNTMLSIEQNTIE